MKQEDRLTSQTLKSNFKHCVDAYSKELLTKCYWEIYDKLCAYEDTGLSPEEIKEMQADSSRLTEQLKNAVEPIWFISWINKLVCCGKVIGYDERSGFVIVCGNDLISAIEIFLTRESAEARLRELKEKL